MRILTPREMISEVNAVLGWSEEARAAYAKGLASYRRAGSPGIPLFQADYQTTWRKQRRAERRRERRANA